MTIACYARLSHENEISVSIENQLSIIKRFIDEKNEFLGANTVEYTDFAASGISLERPSFSRLLTSVRERKIDCIIVKDLSRLGRNYLDVCKLVESIFPFMKVRVIAISDRYDSEKRAEIPYDFSVTFKAILDEFHVMSTSERVRQVFEHKHQMGEFTSSRLPFGYKLENKKAVLVAENAEIVKEIFELRLEKIGCAKIAKRLNGADFPAPKGGTWSCSTVFKMLKNPAYTGVKISRNYIRDIKSKVSRKSFEDEKIIVDDVFPVIISKEIFEKVQKTFPPPKGNSYGQRKGSFFERKIFCEKCQKTLKITAVGLHCKNAAVTGGEPCFYGKLPKERLFNAILDKVKNYLALEISAFNSKFSRADLKAIEAKIEAFKDQKIELFESFFRGEISEENFTFLNQKYATDFVVAKKQKDDFIKYIALTSKFIEQKERPIETIKRLYSADFLEDEHMMFVKKVVVSDAENFEIFLEKESPLTVICKNMKIYGDVLL